MLLTPQVKASVDHCVLAWLATAAGDLTPNVSPKEIFTHFGEDQLLIANIASPRTVKNIRANPRVCISFIDVFVQKGYQLKGRARILSEGDADFAPRAAVLRKLAGDLFPFKTLTEITVTSAKPIIAPRYLLYPDTTEAEQVAAAKRAYKV